MNILYIEHYAGSPEMGMEYRPYYLSREWIRLGHKVTIIAGDYSHLRKNNPVVKCDFQSEMIDGIEYCWLITGAYDGNGVKRALSMERFVRKLWINAKYIADKWKPDIVIASSTYPLDSFPANRIAKIARAKYIHEVHDMWPSTLYEVGGMAKTHPFVQIMQVAENYAYKHCYRCVSLLPYAKEYMEQHGLADYKFVNIQNGVVEEEWFHYDDLPEKHIQEFEKLKGKFIVGYFGGHALSNALDTLLNVAKSINDNSIVFVLVGDGVEKKRLMERAQVEKINNVVFLDPVSKKAVPSLLKQFDCSIMIGADSPLYRFGLSLNKMYDSMMGGIPIICAFNAPSTLVKQYECGIQCRPVGKDITDAVLRLSKLSDDELKQMGQNGKMAIEKNYIYSALAKKFIDCIKD